MLQFFDIQSVDVSGSVRRPVSEVLHSRGVRCSHALADIETWRREYADSLKRVTTIGGGSMLLKLLGKTYFTITALYNRLRTAGQRQRPLIVRNILVPFRPDRLGDILSLTPLLANLHAKYPLAQIVLPTSPSISTLYEHHPFGVVAVPYSSWGIGSLRKLSSMGRYDLAVVPTHKRYGLLALALDARWVVGFAGQNSTFNGLVFDELVSYPDHLPLAFGDLAAFLVPSPPPKIYSRENWLAPTSKSIDLPKTRYCVLHVGASSSLKLWPAERWRSLADWLSNRGMHVVWSGGPGEESIAAQVTSPAIGHSVAGQLDLPQLWKLLSGAALLVCPDTGVAHLGRLTNTPTVALFGPGSTVASGAGDYWRNSPYRSVTEFNVPCRDMKTMYRRHMDWLSRCNRDPHECPNPGACMSAISLEKVIEAIEDVLSLRRPPDLSST